MKANMVGCSGLYYVTTLDGQKIFGTLSPESSVDHVVESWLRWNMWNHNAEDEVDSDVANVMAYYKPGMSNTDLMRWIRLQNK